MGAEQGTRFGFRVLRAAFQAGILRAGNLFASVVHRLGLLWIAIRREVSPEPEQVGILKQSCPLCGFPWLLKVHDRHDGVRCLRCNGGVTHMSAALAIKRQVPALGRAKTYELSSRGPLFRFLSANCASVTGSEYWPDVRPGEWRGAVQCQDIEQLTYPNGSFDLVTSTEVFEHVVNDLRGFQEVRRVLKEGGYFVFTVPLWLNRATLERAQLVEGRIVHLEKPEYHHDSIRGEGRVLAYRTYGLDITDRLRAAGFSAAAIDKSDINTFDGDGRAVVIARR